MLKEFQMTTTRFPIPLASHTLSAGHGSYFNFETEEFDSNMLLTEGRINSHVAYQITGDSAVPYIPPGSWVIVEKHREPHNGDVIACYLNELYFVKVFERKEQRLRLVSPNEDYAPQEVYAHDDFHVLGVVTGCVMRVMREIQTKIPVYAMTDLRDEGDVLHAQFTPDEGPTLELKFRKDKLMAGHQMTAQLIKKQA